MLEHRQKVLYAVSSLLSSSTVCVYVNAEAALPV